jgi:hypothetical protein
MRNLRSIEQTANRIRTETDVRRSLRDWDLSYPEIHHELIVRFLTVNKWSSLDSSAFLSNKFVS